MIFLKYLSAAHEVIHASEPLAHYTIVPGAARTAIFCIIVPKTWRHDLPRFGLSRDNQRRFDASAAAVIELCIIESQAIL